MSPTSFLNASVMGVTLKECIRPFPPPPLPVQSLNWFLGLDISHLSRTNEVVRTSACRKVATYAWDQDKIVHISGATCKPHPRSDVPTFPGDFPLKNKYSLSERSLT